jgi:hypothetical protein
MRRSQLVAMANEERRFSRPWYHAGMTEQPSRKRRIVRRIALWTLGVVLVFVWCLATLPIADVLGDRYPAIGPAVIAVYAPTVVIMALMPEPVRDAYTAYVDWARPKLRRAISD